MLRPPVFAVPTWSASSLAHTDGSLVTSAGSARLQTTGGIGAGVDLMRGRGAARPGVPDAVLSGPVRPRVAP